MGYVKKVYDFFSYTSICVSALLKKRKSKFDFGKNKPLVIIGNGPSADEIDYEKLVDNVDFLCVNDFIFTDLFTKIKPKFYCIVDPVYGSIDYGSDSFKRYAIDIREKTINILENVDWSLKIITKPDFRLRIHNGNIGFFYLPLSELCNPNNNSFGKLIHKLYANNYLIPGFQNVMVPSLFYGVGEGYKKIYVTGLDFSYFDSLIVDEDNHVKNVQNHGSGIKADVTDWTELELIPRGGFYNLLEMYVVALKEFAAIECYAKGMGIVIINTNNASYVDSFIKGSISEE